MWATQGILNLKLASRSNFPCWANQYKERFDNRLLFLVLPFPFQAFRLDHKMMFPMPMLVENVKTGLDFFFWKESKKIYLCLGFAKEQWERPMVPPLGISGKKSHISINAEGPMTDYIISKLKSQE